jgi:hypothetical protein
MSPLALHQNTLKLEVEFYEKHLYTSGEVIDMSNIKPVLDIEEYKEYEKMLAWRKLKSELDKGRQSGEEKGWTSAEELRSHFEARYGN